jgi:hypothetical protein
VRASALDRRIQQVTGGLNLASLERGNAVVQQFVRFPLLLGQGASRTLDVRTGPRMSSVEKQCARPDINRLRVIGGEIVIESAQQQLFDFRVTFSVDAPVACRRGIEPIVEACSKRIGHRWKERFRYPETARLWGKTWL